MAQPFSPKHQVQDTKQLPSALARAHFEEAKKRPLNSTAYRIFKLAQWLMEAPHSVEMLNQRFQEEPGIGKMVSNDSIWLYVNTLKALGCQIKRPSPKNDFCYQMLSHPFGLTLMENHLETLIQVKSLAQTHFSHQEILVLDELFKKFAGFVQLRHNQGENPTDLLFQQSRSIDTQLQKEIIQTLEGAIANGCLLKFEYQAPLKTPSHFTFLPETLFYKQGVMYVRGNRADYEESSTLRVDRIISLQEHEDLQALESLKQRQSCLLKITLHVYANHPEEFHGFNLTPNQGVVSEQQVWVQQARPYYEVQLLAQDTFYLKQALLASSVQFSVQSPASFRQDMFKTLEGMRQYYAFDLEKELSNGECV